MALAEAGRTFGQERPYYSVAQAAELLNVSRVSIWRWISSGKLSAARLGHRTVRISHEDLEDFMGRVLPGTAAVPRDGAPPAIRGFAPRESGHLVQFYDSDDFLLNSVADFFGRAIEAEDAALVVATSTHRAGLARRLATRGLDLVAIRASGQYTELDAADTLARFMVGDLPDAARFMETIGGLMRIRKR